VLLTKAGAMLLPQAEQLIAGARGMLTLAKGMHGQLSGKIRLGTVGDPAVLRLADFLVELHQQFPLLDVHTFHSISGSVLNDVRKKNLDAGFFIGKNPYVNVHSLVLRELTFCVVAPSAWKERLQSASWKDVGKLPWVWINQFNSYNKLSTELFREKNIAPQKVFELDQESTTLALVKAGVGMSLMRDELAQEAIKSGEVIEWGGVRKTTPLNFIYPAECRDDPLVNAMLQVLHGMWLPLTSQ
jgi:DNA-binding transcriptional LysR family regulator